MRKRSIAIAVIIVAVGGYLANEANEAIRNSYAVWWVSDMVVEHLDANSGEWPASWNDLKDDYQLCVDRSGQPWTF